jgi:hypothetical protein
MPGVSVSVSGLVCVLGLVLVLIGCCVCCVVCCVVAAAAAVAVAVASASGRRYLVLTALACTSCFLVLAPGSSGAGTG